MTLRLLVLPLLFVALSGSGCAAVINGTRQSVQIETTPAGATALVLPEGNVVTTPARLDLVRKQAHTLRISKEGYETEFVYLDRIASGAVNGNLILGGLIGMSVDSSTGGAFQLIPKEVNVVLEPIAEDTRQSASPDE